MQSGFDALEDLTAASTALFLDFDGTLAKFADEPHKVAVDPEVLAALQSLRKTLGGAIAIISGRDIATLDKFLRPSRFPASGVHGYETRIRGSAVHRKHSDTVQLQKAKSQLQPFVSQHQGLLLEAKPASFAVHFRNRPDLAAEVDNRVRHALCGMTGLKLLHGKMVLEVKSHSADKGTSLRSFMDAPPFASRQPVFIGDDVTDEAGFAVANDLDGISIKVGPGETAARYRLADTSDVALWLEKLLNQLTAANLQGATTE